MIRSSIAVAVIAAASFGAHADTYDQNVTTNVIFGSGVSNGSFTVDRANGVELGLRGKLRFDASGQPQNTYYSNGSGGYNFAAGVAPTKASPTAIWSFEWSINSDYLPDDQAGGSLAAYTYLLGIDTNSSLTKNFLTFDPIHGVNPGNGMVLWDHSIGKNDTGQGLGAEATTVAIYTGLIAANNLAQNSWQPAWFIPGFDPTVDGVYSFFLSAFDGQTEIARTDIDIIVGQGSTAYIPEPASLALVGVALAGLAASRRRKQS